jgi:hypothetical protein
LQITDARFYKKQVYLALKIVSGIFFGSIPNKYVLYNNLQLSIVLQLIVKRKIKFIHYA